MSWLSKGAKGVTKGLKEVLGFGGSPGPSNPYGKPDLAYLADTSKLDFLKDPNLYKAALNTSGYDFLKNPVAVAPSASKFGDIPGELKTFSDTYKPPTGVGDDYFKAYLDSINAPSSVDQVQSGVDSDLMKQLLEGIDTDTRNSVGSLKSDFADRGLGGPGMLSDIEGNSLAQAYSSGDKTKASARNDFATKELARMKAQEDAKKQAFATRYGVGTAADTQDKSIAAQGALSDSTGFNSALLDSLKSEVGAEQTAGGMTNQNLLSFANLLGSGQQNYAGLTSSGNNLFANLLNARDLGAAGINSSNYNTGVQDQYQYQKPGILDSILRNTQLSFEF